MFGITCPIYIGLRQVGDSWQGLLSHHWPNSGVKPVSKSAYNDAWPIRIYLFRQCFWSWCVQYILAQLFIGLSVAGSPDILQRIQMAVTLTELLCVIISDHKGLWQCTAATLFVFAGVLGYNLTVLISGWYGFLLESSLQCWHTTLLKGSYLFVSKVLNSRLSPSWHQSRICSNVSLLSMTTISCLLLLYSGTPESASWALQTNITSMAYYKTVLTPDYKQWNYLSIVLSNWYDVPRITLPQTNWTLRLSSY